MTTLVKMAFQNLPGGKGSMADIYAWITKEYPYYSKMKVGKCNSLIRATLYNTKCFRRTKKDKKVWKMDSNYDIQNLKRRRNSSKDFFHGFGTRLFCVLILRFIEISTN